MTQKDTNSPKEFVKKRKVASEELIKKKKIKIPYLTSIIHKTSLVQLQAFHACVYFGSRTLAAVNLEVSETAITQRLHQLETKLKIKLLTRDRTGFGITYEGKILYDSLETVFQELTMAYNEVRGKRPLEKITIYTTVPLGIYVLTSAFLKFQKKYPTVNLSICVDSNYPDIKLGGADIVIWSLDNANKNFISHQVGRFSLKLYASPDYLKEKGTPQTVADLKYHQFISVNLGLTNFVINWHIQLAKPPSNRITETNNSILAIRLCEEGGGIVSYSPTMVRKIGWKVVNVLPDLEREAGDAYLMHHKSLKDNEQVKDLIGFVKAELDNLHKI